MPSGLMLSLLLSIAAIFLFWAKKGPKKGPNLPPGPPGVPLIGNVLDIPAENQDVALYKLGKTYGMPF